MSENANSSIDTATEDYKNTPGVAPVISPAPTGPAPTEAAVTAPAPPSRAMVDENSAAGKAGINAKEDWFLTRVTAPDISTKNLFDVYGVDGFTEFKSKEEYWKDSKVQKQFSNTYGSEAKMRFDQAYDNSKKEFANFQLGQYQRSQTGHELIRDDLSALRMDVTTRFSNMAGTLKTGDDWTAPTKDYRENFSAIKVKEIDADGKESYVIKEYSPELLKELEEDPTFGGLAYSDAFYGMDPNEGVNGLYFNAIHDGRVLDEATGKLADVRDDQVVSRWDLDTGPTSMLGMFDVNLGRVFKNNKLEADGVLDYAKILVRSPFNMAINVMDTAVQLTRASIAGGYGVASMFTDDDLDVRTSDLYNWFTTKGIKLKSNNTSMSREAMQDGFFGSLEAALTTTADVALQIALAGGLGRAGAGAAGMINGGLSGAALQQAQNRAAEVSVRGVLTAMSVKDSYNEAIENGYSTSEASVITGAMAVAMWKATKYASYILGDYEVKVLRANIKSAMQTEQQGLLKTLFESVAKEAPKVAAKKKAKFALESMQKVVSNIFGKATKVLPSSHMFYVARQEGFEEMTEELFQDGVKQVASAYGALINNAHAAGKGRYSTIFDDGYFKDAAERYLTSGVAGAIGGPMGMIGHKVDLSPITSASSMTDILMDGRKEELISVLTEMKNEGNLGPKNLSPEWNEALEAFEPIIQGSGSESLADMIFKQYEHDINVVDTFINKGMFGEAKNKIEADDRLKDFVDNNAMRKDYVKLMGTMLEFHNATGISMSVYSELDELEEGKLFARIPSILKETSEKLAEKNKEIADIKEATKAKKSSSESKKDSKKEDTPKTEKKPKEEKVIGESSDTKLTRLEKEVKLSSTVKDSDIVTMLSNYRKIRAISTGVAAEYYLLQNEVADNTMLGSKYNREEKHANLGEEPFKDMLMAMRFRAKADELVHAQTAQVAAELEERIVSVVDSSEEGVDSLDNILKDASYGMLSEKALKAITKLYDKADFKETSIAFDPNHEDSIFVKGDNGKATEADMLDLYKEIMLLTNDSNAEMVASGEELNEKLTPDVVAKFFRSIVKDVKKSVVPEWALSMEDGTPEIQDYGQNLIEMIMAKGSNRLKGAIKVSGDHVLNMKKISDKAAKSLEMESFYRNDPFKRKGINSLFKKASGGTLLSKSLVDDGLSSVRALLDSGHEGIYTLTDSSRIDDVLEQMEVRLEVAKVLSQFVTNENGRGGHYLRMLADFRQNVLDIIDFKYGYNSAQDTEIEEHSYKDYTVTSDYFTDFLYDPILIAGIIEKDPSLRTQADKEMMSEIDIASSLLKPTAIKGIGNPVYESMNLEIDEVALNTYLDSLMNASPGEMVDFRTMEGAVEFLESSKILNVPAAVVGIESFDTVPLLLDGVTKVMAARWLLKKSSDFIAKVADKATPLPYIQAKNNDNSFTMRTLRGLIEDESINGLAYLVDKEAPELAIALAQDIEDISPNEVGAINIKIENALFKIYNNLGLQTSLTPAEALEMREGIDEHINAVNGLVGNSLSDNSFIARAAEASKRLSILIGAVTTDFTPFYSKFKRDIEAMTEYDNIVVAAQEHAAKHAGAYIYSAEYRKMADNLSEERMSFMETVNHISAVYVTGIAGSGKSSSVIQTGLKLAVEILEDSGYLNTAVLPVSTFKAQIDIVTKSVGELSKGLKGMSVEELHSLLIDAVNNKDADAITTLSAIGIIAIDEATYVEASAIRDENLTELESIDALIQLFNERHNITGHKIGLLLLGDPKQSGATDTIEGVFYDTSLKVRRAHPIAYMDFSFRSRNTFLGDSLSAISLAIEVAEGDMGFKPDFIKMEPGTKYGTAAGKFYGIQMVDSANKESSEDFYKVLNDDVLLDNIENNILKNIADNESRPEGSPEIKFNVLIAPSDKVSYDKNPSKMKTLSEKEGYAKYFKVVPAKMVGGSEANYVIGEVVNSEEGGGSTYLKTLSKTLNTLATRAFDYAIIINRNDDIIISSEAASRLMPDGEVMIPDASLDGSAKAKLKDNYMEILKDVVSAEAASVGTRASEEENVPGASTTLALPASPKVLLLMPHVELPGHKFEIPKDTIALNFTSVVQFVEGAKALLSHRGSHEAFTNLSTDNKDLVKRYLTEVEFLLFSTDADKRVDSIAELDEISKSMHDFLDTELYESLIGLQVFSVDLTDEAIQEVMKNHIAVTLDTLNMSIEDLTTTMPDGIKVDEFLAEIERTVSDPTLTSTYEKLFTESGKKRKSKVYKNLMISLLEDVKNSLQGPKATGNQLGLFDVTETSPEVSKKLAAKMQMIAQSVVLARASLLSLNLQQEAPKVDLAVISKQLDLFSIWATVDLDKDQLTLLIKQLEPGNTSSEMTLPKNISGLYELGYSSESVTEALLNAALVVKKKRDAAERKAKRVAKAAAAKSAEAIAKKKAEASAKKKEEEEVKKANRKTPPKTYEDNIKRIADLKVFLGISEDVIGAMDLYTNINKVQNALWKSLKYREMSNADTDTMLSIIEIQDLWNKLYKGHSSTFGADNYGKGFVYRPYTTNTRKETLKDYIDAFNRGSGVFTAHITKFNLETAEAINPNSKMQQKVYSPKEALDIFNYSGNSKKETPKKVVLRVSRLVRVSQGKVITDLDVLIMAQDGLTNHVVSQLDTKEGGAASNQLRKDLEAALLKVQYDSTKVFKVGGKDVMDIVITDGEIKDFLFTRPGGVITAEEAATLQGSEFSVDDYMIAPSRATGNNFQELSVEDLRKFINVSEKMFINLAVDAISIEGNDVGNMHGEGFVVYSSDRSTLANKNLDSPLIEKTFKNGRGLDASNRIQVTDGAIPTELGVMRVMFKAPLDKLGEILKANPDVQMGAFTSHFSVALQEYFVQHGSSIKVGQPFVLASSKTPTEEMSNHSFVFTKELKEHYELVGRDLARHYAKKGDAYEKEIKAVLKVMTDSKILKEALDDFAVGYLMNNGLTEGPSGTRVSSIIYPNTSNSGGYVFNINEYLRGNSAATLKKLTMLSDIAKFTLKPNVRKGKNDHMGTVDTKFTNMMSPFMKTSIVGIKIPSFIISTSGTAKIRAAINDNAPVVEVIKYTDKQLAFFDELEVINDSQGVEVTNKLLSLGSTELARMLDEISFITSSIKKDASIEKDNDRVILDIAKSRIQGVYPRALKASIGSTDSLLPSFVVNSQDSNHPVRSAFSKVFLEYEGGVSTDPAVRQEAIDSALELFGFIDEDNYVENANDPSAAVKEALAKVMENWGEDEDFIEFLNKCNF